jgi:Plant transposon protein
MTTKVATHQCVEDRDDDLMEFETIVAEDQVPVNVWGGSPPGRSPNLKRHRVFYSHLLYKDFWGPSPVYNATYFKRFFKLPIGLFNQIVERIVVHDLYFLQKKCAAGRLGLSSMLQKACSALRLLTSGVSSSEHDDKYCMASSTGLEGMKRFCLAINEIYAEESLRHPSMHDIKRLLDEGEAAGFPGYIGSIDCMHWEWKNRPSGWKGMFQGKSRTPTVVLEAIADHSTRFWHFNFGCPGSLNDINVLDRSPLFYNAVRGDAPRVDFTVNHHQHSQAYWLADGIYPTYACFVKTIPKPSTRMQKHFATAQEAKRKDIERAFGILQARFHILTSGCRLWSRDAMGTVIRTCVILDNMIVDYEREHNVDGDYIHHPNYAPLHPFVVVPRNVDQTKEEREALMCSMKNQEQHTLIQNDVMVQMWEKWNGANANEDGEGEEEEEEEDNNVVHQQNKVVLVAFLLLLSIHHSLDPRTYAHRFTDS